MNDAGCFALGRVERIDDVTRAPYDDAARIRKLSEAFNAVMSPHSAHPHAAKGQGR
jgi:hypothetical protein